MAGKKASVGSATAGRDEIAPSEPAYDKIAELTGWRVKKLARIRHLIFEGESDVVEEVKLRKPTPPPGS